MAGNKNPWRDIFSQSEWNLIRAHAPAAAAGVMGRHRQAQGAGWTVVTANRARLVGHGDFLAEIDRQIQAYDLIPKDVATRFSDRSTKLKYISTLCNKYLQSLAGTGRALAVKQATGKQLNDPLEVWVRSLGARALKKAGYLQTMGDWHASAKAKYKDRTQLSLFLRGLSADNTRDDGGKLHATPYATVEKVDPYHRQTFVFLDTDSSGVTDQSVNEMGSAFLDYLGQQPASNPDRATNANATFYEWLEYHPFCIGTPGVLGDARFKSPATISYQGQDLAYVYMVKGQMQYEMHSDPGRRYIFNTTDFRQSGKGPPGAVAFVWDADGHLWCHEHGWDGFVHASAKQGRKIRCSGMLVASNGKATHITNQSGHYAPNAKSIYYFTSWLGNRDAVDPAAKVIIEHDATLADGTYQLPQFRIWARSQGLLPQPVPYFA